MTTDRPWEGSACHYRHVFRDGDTYRMYYTALDYDVRGGRVDIPHPGRIALAESADGITWTRPSLGLVEFDGSTDNNLVADAGESHTFVFKDTNPAAPAEARYKAIELADNATAIYPLRSADGLTFTRMSDKPMMVWKRRPTRPGQHGLRHTQRGVLGSRDRAVPPVHPVLARPRRRRHLPRDHDVDVDRLPHVVRPRAAAVPRLAGPGGESLHERHRPLPPGSAHLPRLPDALRPATRLDGVAPASPQRRAPAGTVAGQRALRHRDDRHALHEQPGRHGLRPLGRGLHPARPGGSRTGSTPTTAWAAGSS
jgi:hypothetical protein